MLTTLFVSSGTPMLLAGDEFGRTQEGNNNAYCQDNEISWLDWVGRNDRGRSLAHCVHGALIALRHEHPLLHVPQFLHGDEIAGERTRSRMAG